eukprot:1160264-Pelagomonas_calceolata.AAC.7
MAEVVKGKGKSERANQPSIVWGLHSHGPLRRCLRTNTHPSSALRNHAWAPVLLRSLSVSVGKLLLAHEEEGSTCPDRILYGALFTFTAAICNHWQITGSQTSDGFTAIAGGKLSNSKQGSAASHKKGGHSGGSGAAQKKAPPPEPPQDHFYFYPKMDPNVSAGMQARFKCFEHSSPEDIAE